jgi:hypothetical protein
VETRTHSTVPRRHAQPTSANAGADPFARARFILRQDASSPPESCLVWDENQAKLLFVERSRRTARNLLALLSALVAFLVVVVSAGFLSGLILSNLDRPGSVKGMAASLSLLSAVAAAFVTTVALVPKRRLSVYRDEGKGDMLLQVEQDKKIQVLRATYTVTDPTGAVLARLSKDHLNDPFQERWTCRAADGALLCTIEKEATSRSLARRLLGPLLRRRPTRFVFRNGTHEIGGFAGQVVDVSQETQDVFDRRVALAIGLLLDTNARR